MERMDRRWSIIPCESIEELARQMAAGGSTTSWMTTPNDPGAVERLKGNTFALLLDGDITVILDFSDPKNMVWTWNGVKQPPCKYGVACAPGMPDVIFLHYYCVGERYPRCVELVLDLATSYCTVIDARLGQIPENPREVVREIHFGEIEDKDHPGGSARHCYTTDLVGRAIHWEMPAFTGKPPIKHIYLSPKYYGIFMTRDDACFMSADPAEYIRIRDDLYLVTVVEERRSGIQLSFLINTDLLEDVVGHFGISMGNEAGEDMPQITCTMMTGRKGTFVPMETVF